MVFINVLAYNLAVPDRLSCQAYWSQCDSIVIGFDLKFGHSGM